ncbi:hypothetical protein CULT_130045 [[Clostridium] ultunense Esp]|uniref:DUF6115 domain-containing protein n=1 Tax=Thermicanus aegyptius TaxID=94009 RepID=UPI0002B701F1|nr:hypothetical protein [Thermicanus aegyptius]CCQ93300.1 hypothetical protein CULT_130045 [[Clostridium] ultunense Esp]
METIFLLTALLIVNIILILLLLFTFRNIHKRMEEWEGLILEQHEKLTRWIERLMEEKEKKELLVQEKAEERAQKRYHYVKKGLNDILDALDKLHQKGSFILEAKGREVKPVHTESAPNEERRDPSFAVQEIRREEWEEKGEAKVPEILSLYHQGESPFAIAKKLQIPIPQVELVLQIFTNPQKEMNG